MKKMLIATIISLSALYAYAQSDSILSQPTTDKYSCDEGSYSFELTHVDKDTVKLLDGAGNQATLKSQVSGSGEQYSNSKYELSLKGNEGMLIYKENGKSYPHENCKIE